ncbi:hypothetical protein JXC34_03455 [Candidatus Woesearchaeota archaeon]|nr:hypothetical protein [Candidatus Woesearchaeota archaeon]
MTYIKKTTTIVLFLLLVLLVGLFTGASVYYQRTLSRLNDVIRNKEDKITSMSIQIKGLNYNVSLLSEILRIQLEKEENLTAQYVNLVEETSSLSGAKEEIETELTDTEQLLLGLNQELEDCEDNYFGLEEDYLDLNETLADVVQDVLDICDEASPMNISECEDYT